MIVAHRRQRASSSRIHKHHGVRGANRKSYFNDVRDGALGKFIHDPAIKPDDGLAGPVIGRVTNPDTVRGGSYAPYVVEAWTKITASELDIYYTLSTWNPYVVMLMKSSMEIH